MRQQAASGYNTGFRMIDSKMVQYKQIHNGLLYFYAKRKVMEDGISTKTFKSL